MLIRLLNRFVVAALFAVMGGFMALLAWMFMHQRRAPPFDGSIFDPGLGHRVLVVGAVCAAIGFLGRDLFAGWVRRQAVASLAEPPPDAARRRRVQRLLMVLAAIAAVAFHRYAHEL